MVHVQRSEVGRLRREISRYVIKERGGAVMRATLMKATFLSLSLSLSLSFPLFFFTLPPSLPATRRSLITLVIIKIKIERDNKTDDDDDRPPWFVMMMMMVIIVIITALVTVAVIFIISKQMVISRIFVAVARAFTGCSLIKKLGIVVRDVCMHARACARCYNRGRKRCKPGALHLFLFVRVFQRFY